MQLIPVVKNHVASRQTPGVGINMIEKTDTLFELPLRIIP
jgi:hypothetical protein